jgi:hypothetical protein
MNIRCAGLHFSAYSKDETSPVVGFRHIEIATVSPVTRSMEPSILQLSLLEPLNEMYTSSNLVIVTG